MIRPSVIKRFRAFTGLVAVAAFVAASPAFARAADQPVLLYSQYLNAPGENRYPVDGNYRPAMEGLDQEFDIRVDAEPLTAERLAGVKVLLIVNPNQSAHQTNPPPHRLSAEEGIALYNWIYAGGGLILMGNQENHNLEIDSINQHLLRLVGLKWVNRYTDAKRLVLPPDLPIVGGLAWAYYTGNLVEVTPHHPAKARSLVENDLTQKPAMGPRDEPGSLLAIAEVGAGRIAVVTDSGWLANWALGGQGVGGVAIKEQDNLEIMLRLTRWVAGINPVRD
ncbi:MAG TPA: hypothetical protein DCY13_21305 [Verrucomicrobiales bacterium]|nr:hypothetical protein [Verrucomicrobiales bacterium]